MFKGWEWQGQVSQSWQLQIEAGEWAWTVWRLAALFRACQVVPEEETDTVVEGGRGWVWGLFFSWFYWSYYMWRWESGLLSTPITKAVLSCSNEWEGARGRARGGFRELDHRAASVEWQYFSRGVQACWKANPGLIDSSFNCDCHWGVWPVPPSFLHSWARVWTEQHCEWDLCGYPGPAVIREGWVALQLDQLTTSEWFCSVSLPQSRDQHLSRELSVSYILKPSVWDRFPLILG